MTPTTSKSAPSVKLTYKDLLLFPDDGKRHELIDGVHYVTPTPILRHQTISLRLSVTLANYLDRHPIGQVWTAPLDCVLSNVDVVEPDLMYVSNDRTSILTLKNIQGAPDLVVEILSPGTRKRDEGIKRLAYERFGVVEYWIVSPDRNRLQLFRQQDGRLARVAELSAEKDDMLTTPLLPGLEIRLTALFR